MASNLGAGCLHFFHLGDHLSQTQACGPARCEKTLSFAKVGLGACSQRVRYGGALPAALIRLIVR